MNFLCIRMIRNEVGRQHLSFVKINIQHFCSWAQKKHLFSVRSELSCLSQCGHTYLKRGEGDVKNPENKRYKGAPFCYLCMRKAGATESK